MICLLVAQSNMVPGRIHLPQNVGASRTEAQAAWHFPKAELQARIEAGAVAPIVAPHVKPAAE